MKKVLIIIMIMFLGLNLSAQPTKTQVIQMINEEDNFTGYELMDWGVYAECKNGVQAAFHFQGGQKLIFAKFVFPSVDLMEQLFWAFARDSDYQEVSKGIFYSKIGNTLITTKTDYKNYFLTIQYNYK